MELEQQLGGLFGLLTVEFLVPYLNRKLSIFQKTGEIPRLPKGMVKPIIVAGINSLGRGQDAAALAQFLQTIAQTMGPEAIGQIYKSRRSSQETRSCTGYRCTQSCEEHGRSTTERAARDGRTS